MASIFLDESGHFGKTRNGEEYFIVGSFMVGEPRRTAKGFRKWFRSHFPNKMRAQSEIKWSATGIADKLRIKTLEYIAKLDVRIKYVYFLKKNIPSGFRDGDKFKEGLLYTNVIGELLDMWLPGTGQDFRVFCDTRKLSGITNSEFKEILKTRISPHFSSKVLIRIEMVDSASNVNIQVADWISGALARYHEKGKMGQDFYNALKGNLMNEGKELFDSFVIED